MFHILYATKTIGCSYLVLIPYETHVADLDASMSLKPLVAGDKVGKDSLIPGFPPVIYEGLLKTELPVCVS